MKKISYYSVRQSRNTLSLLDEANFTNLKDAEDYVTSILDETIRTRRSHGSSHEFTIKRFFNMDSPNLDVTFQFVTINKNGWIVVENIFIEKHCLILDDKKYEK